MQCHMKSRERRKARAYQECRDAQHHGGYLPSNEVSAHIAAQSHGQIYWIRAKCFLQAPLFRRQRSSAAIDHQHSRLFTK